MKVDFFLDTAFAIALISPKDSFHGKALELAKQIRKTKAHLVTTQAIIIEIGNALSKESFRKSAVELIDSMEADETITIISISGEVYREAFNLFRSRLDKEWGLTDCISFVVMEQRGIKKALTTDQHFEQAGFIARVHAKVVSNQCSAAVLGGVFRVNPAPRMAQGAPA